MCGLTESEKISKRVGLIVSFIDCILQDNFNSTEESKITDVGFEFGTKSGCYNTEEFKTLVDEYFRGINAEYTFTEVRENVLHFTVDLQNAKKEEYEYRGFEIKCLDCGSTNVECGEDYDEDCDGEWFSLGNYMQCNDCGQRT